MNCWTPLKSADGRPKLVFNDFVIKYDVCNFKCDYCLNQMKPDGTDIWKKTEKDSNIKDVAEDCDKVCDAYDSEPLIYSEDSSLGKRMDQLVANFEEAIDVAILRISGGEVLAIKGIDKFMQKHSHKYEVIQIVTNGYYLTKETVAKLAEIGNCQLHYSLDGHNLDLNGFRVKSESVQARLMDNLENAVNAGLEIEISSILTTANTKNFVSFLEYLLRYEGRVKVHPAPVRGKPLLSFFPDRESIEEFSKILENYDRYKSILPPIAYMEELVKFMKEDARVLRCHLPKVSIQSIDKGALTPCPNGWTIQLGNLLCEDGEEVASRIGNDKIYNILLHKRPRLEYCKICFTAYDVVSLYIGGRISDAELETLPLYSGPKVKERMRLLKEEYQNSQQV